MTSKEPMFKIIPWRVSHFKNYNERLKQLVEMLSELDEYTIELSHETDKNNNENLVLWLYYELSSEDELIQPFKNTCEIVKVAKLDQVVKKVI